MSDIGGLASAPPFPGSYRASGLLLHVTSLPSPYGTGDLGPCACAWIDHLHHAGHLWNYLKRAPGDSAEAAPALMRLAWLSVAALAIVPLQDLLNLGKEARMNVPGRADGNWRWRATEGMLSLPAFDRLRELTESTKGTAVRVASAVSKDGIMGSRKFATDFMKTASH